MTTKALKAMFWKEYRQQILLVTAIFFLGVILQLSLYTASFFSNQAPAFWTVAVGAVALYAAGASSVLFVREHEERTFAFLRSLPITGDSIFVGKLMWLLASTLSLGVLLGLETLLWVVAAGSNDNGATVFGVMGVAVVEAICWGLFWSTRTRSQLNALLGTFVSASVGAYLMAMLWNAVWNKGGSVEISDAYSNAWLFRLGLAALIGIAGVVHARKWFDAQITPVDTTPQLTPEQRAAERQAMLAPPKRGEMRWLMWLAYRQSRTLFIYLGALFAVTVVLVTYNYESAGGHLSGDQHFGLAVLMLFGTVSGLIFCGSTFHKDQQNNAAAMLTNYGVSPGKIWWSRVLVFGAAYAVFIVPLLVIYAMFMQGGSVSDFYRPFLCYEPNVRYYVSDFHFFRDLRLQASLFVAVTLFASIFCIGQMVSLFLRSLVASLVTTAALFLVGVYGWSIAVKYLLGYSGLVWAVWPMLLACLVASRLRAANWQRGRNSWAGWRVPVLTLAIPAACILVAYPLVRVYSVPVINLGYYIRPDYILYDSDKTNANEKTLYDLKTRAERERTLEALKQYWEFYRNSTTNPSMAVRFYDSGKRDFYWLADCQANSGNATKESLLELIAFLKSIDENPVSYQDIVARTYEIEYRDAWNGIVPDPQRGMAPFWYRYLMPWEKYRVMRRLDYEFQVLMSQAEAFDQSVATGKRTGGRFNDQYRYRYDSFLALEERYREILQSNSQLLGQKTWMIYDFENKRRGLIIVAALHAWYLEHGELPEKLEQLEGVYFDKLPKPLSSGETFGWWPKEPNPKRPSWISSNENEKKIHIPYISASEGWGSEYELWFLRPEK
ncbi:MAG: ABC transporter permease [Planctomycetaceae bacterium]|nr:ABC transporter permease [Planctomycetaceae bacterium]